jgi:MFS family permease
LTETFGRIFVAKSYSTVVGLRVLVGASESFVNAAPLYLSLWYKREELATRGAIFFATSAIAGSFNGIIAYGIQQHLDGAMGRAAWRWLFLIEGQKLPEPLCPSTFQ